MALIGVGTLKGESENRMQDQGLGSVNAQQATIEEGPAINKAENEIEILEQYDITDKVEEPPSKRVKLDPSADSSLGKEQGAQNGRRKGIAPIKTEFLVNPHVNESVKSTVTGNSDAVEREGGQKKEKSKGQNFNRNFGSSKDEVGLCQSRASYSEFSPAECRFGEKCKFEHDLRRYLNEWKREDLLTLDGVCPVWKAKGKCDAGWKCRFVGSHMRECDAENGRKELVLIENECHRPLTAPTEILNVVSTQAKSDLMKRKMPTPKADKYSTWLDTNAKEAENQFHHSHANNQKRNMDDDENDQASIMNDNRARYTEPPLMPSEKRRIYFGPETPVLAPLTTQGNLPFRRLCVGLGAQITYSEMAMSLPLIQGQKSEWALMKAHESETVSPRCQPIKPIVAGYDNVKDFRFGAQIAANKSWQSLKATEILTTLCPYLRVIDLNCGCPIDLVYRTGAGSALLDSPSKLEKIIRGMNAVSGEIPITVKIRMGTKDGKPTAYKLVDRLIYGGQEALEMGGGPSGTAAITLHGRSRQQRYTKTADWQYIADCAALINRFNEKGDDLADTIRETDGRSQSPNSKMYFLGNGDCYSHEDYNSHLNDTKVDSVMIARGALIKPWIFEEIQQGQYIDKSASERLAMIEQYVRYGLETWGSDEIGVGVTRRFLLEWLSFAYRYVPVGILEYLPPSLQDRPPAWRGRNELETLLGSDNYKDWIKISEMFLGPANRNFRFEPKHKSNSYEIEAEG